MNEQWCSCPRQDRSFTKWNGLKISRKQKDSQMDDLRPRFVMEPRRKAFPIRPIANPSELRSQAGRNGRHRLISLRIVPLAATAIGPERYQFGEPGKLMSAPATVLTFLSGISRWRNDATGDKSESRPANRQFVRSPPMPANKQTAKGISAILNRLTLMDM